METAAQAVLGARAQYPTSTLADLYDPLTMPALPLPAQQDLDRAVDRCYRPEPFPIDRHRVGYLFGLFEQPVYWMAPLPAALRFPLFPEPPVQRALSLQSNFTPLTPALAAGGLAAPRESS